MKAAWFKVEVISVEPEWLILVTSAHSRVEWQGIQKIISSFSDQSIPGSGGENLAKPVHREQAAKKV
jgi:hypothetical protein